MVILRFLRWLLLLAVFLCLLLYVSLEGVCLYTLSKLDPTPMTTPAHSPPEALDLLWVSLGERGEIQSSPYSVATYPFLAYDYTNGGLPPGVRLSSLVSMVQLGKSKQRILGWHADNILLASWHSRHSQVRPMLQYALDQSYYGGGAYGAENAALYFYGKNQASLTLSEWVVMLAVLKAPGIYKPMPDSDDDRLRKRSVWLFEKLQENWPDKYQDEVFQFPDFARFNEVQEEYRRCLNRVPIGDKNALDACRANRLQAKP